jgi:hypothetical protein
MSGHRRQLLRTVLFHRGTGPGAYLPPGLRHRRRQSDSLPSQRRRSAEARGAPTVSKSGRRKHKREGWREGRRGAGGYRVARLDKPRHCFCGVVRGQDDVGCRPRHRLLLGRANDKRVRHHRNVAGQVQAHVTARRTRGPSMSLVRGMWRSAPARLTSSPHPRPRAAGPAPRPAGCNGQ